jgi:hypothetical protein
VSRVAGHSSERNPFTSAQRFSPEFHSGMPPGARDSALSAAGNQAR